METKRLVLLAILLAASVVLNIVERVALGGLTGLPMIRLGLANIIILIILYLFSAKDAFVVLILRIFLVGLFTALFSPTFWLSFGGGMVAYGLMISFKAMKVFSIVGVSVVGAFGHALGQVLMAMLLLSTQELFLYLPFLVGLSIPTGILTGFVALKMVRILNQTFYLNPEEELFE